MVGGFGSTAAIAQSSFLSLVPVSTTPPYPAKMRPPGGGCDFLDAAAPCPPQLLSPIVLLPRGHLCYDLNTLEIPFFMNGDATKSFKVISPISHKEKT